MACRNVKYIDMIRFEGPLFFANASYLEDKITDRMLSKKTLKHIVIVANGMNDIDASGEEVLSLVVATVRSAGHGHLLQRRQRDGHGSSGENPSDRKDRPGPYLLDHGKGHLRRS